MIEFEMAEGTVLAELAQDILPHWIVRLQKYLPQETKGQKTITPESIIPESSNQANVPVKVGPVVMMAPVELQGPCDQKTPDLPSPGTQTPEYGSKMFAPLTIPHGTSKLNSKPDTAKSRFSAITGPTIYYDGESQEMLHQLWNTINTKRGSLRREMMSLKRRQQFAAIATQASEDESTDDEDKKEDDNDESETDDGAELLRMKMKLQRERMLRMTRRANPMTDFAPSSGAGAQKRKAGSAIPSGSSTKGDDDKLKTLLEAIDDNLDKAAKVCETAAFVWLKGDVCVGHLQYMTARLRDTIRKIEASGFVKSNPETAKEVPPASPDEDKVPMPPLSKAVEAGKDTPMKDPSVLEVASSCQSENSDAESIESTENPKLAMAKRRMRESAARMKARGRAEVAAGKGEKWTSTKTNVVEVGVIS